MSKSLSDGQNRIASQDNLFRKNIPSSLLEMQDHDPENTRPHSLRAPQKRRGWERAAYVIVKMHVVRPSASWSTAPTSFHRVPVGAIPEAKNWLSLNLAA